MLRTVTPPRRRFSDYREVSDPEQYESVRKLADRLKGARILHLSATAHGGGVAEILRSYVPLLNDLGLKVTWQVLQANQDFFTVTKMIHNGLQGEPTPLTIGQWETYLDYNRQLAKHLDTNRWDFVMVHDPQPASLITYCDIKHFPHWAWRCHIDTRHASQDFINHFVEYLKPYEGVIFTMEKYLFGGIKPSKLAIIPPAIDPLSHKNEPISREATLKIVKSFGINVNRPLMVQVSRFDPWKNQLGTVESWQLAKRDVPHLQLALIGSRARDDPQSNSVLEQLKEHTKGMKDLHIIYDRADDRQVSAFQDFAVVVMQRSIREGFGLTVAEALWSGTPVIGSKIGGIPEQIQSGKNGYLVDNSEQAAKRIVELVKDPAEAKRMGQRGRSFVKRHFLLPRLIRDDLRFLLSL